MKQVLEVMEPPIVLPFLDGSIGPGSHSCGEEAVTPLRVFVSHAVILLGSGDRRAVENFILFSSSLQYLSPTPAGDWATRQLA